MNPRDYFRTIRLQQKRERKRIKRLRIARIRYGRERAYHRITRFQRTFDKQILRHFRNRIYDFLVRIDFVDNKIKPLSKIEIPEIFSFATNYEKSLEVIRQVAVSFYHQAGSTLEVSFENCKEVDALAVSSLQIILMEFYRYFQALHRKLTRLNVRVDLKRTPSKVDAVNKVLFVHQFLDETELKQEGLMPYSGIGYIIGKKDQRHYAENKKGANVTRIRAFINGCLRGHGYEFNKDGANQMDGLLSEMLGNGEDHSPLNTYYVTASSFIEAKKVGEASFVGEVNLSIMNFGYSFYQGLEETREENKENYQFVEEMYEKVEPFVNDEIFSRENLFTLYALQPGVSRLRYTDDSRGNGTMKFLDSFFALGDFEDEQRHFHPRITLVSGRTMLICNNKYRPFPVNSVNFLSLNPEKDFGRPPDPENLKKLPIPYPGTILDIKVYINKEHLQKKLNDNQQNRY